jgi:peptidoglycan hydrolase CwlO-like protein
MRHAIKLAVLSFAILGTGCVTSRTYNAKVAELDKAVKDQDGLKQENAKLQAQVDDLSKQIADQKKSKRSR